MKALVTGAGGFLGRHVVDSLLNEQIGVHALISPSSARERRLWLRPVQVSELNLCVDDLSGLLTDVDVVIHLATRLSARSKAAVTENKVATLRLLQAMERAGCRRIIHVSSLSVYNLSKAGPVLDEGTPIFGVSDANIGEYARSKLLQEELVRQYEHLQKFKVTILRPGFLWGPGKTDLAGAGRRFKSLYVSVSPRRTIPICSVDNCADVLVKAVLNTNAIGQTFNVLDQTDVTVQTYLSKVYAAQAIAVRVFSIPYWAGYALAAAATSVTNFLRIRKPPSILNRCEFESQFKPICFSNKKLKDILDWTPPLSFERCVDLLRYDRSKP